VFVRPDLRLHAKDLVDKARMAPSLHNAQPWAFRVQREMVEVYADRDRAVRVLDPYDRQLFIGVGAALFVVRLGIKVLGAKPVVTLFPQGEPEVEEPEVKKGMVLAARLWVEGEHMPEPAEVRLLEQVEKRRTIRERMDPALPEKTREALASAASAENADLRWVQRPEERAALAHLVSIGESREQADAKIQAELTQWVGGQTVRHGSGVPEEALGASGELARTAMFVPRDFAGGRPRLAPDLEGQEEQPTVAVLTTPGDRPVNWLCAGQAMMRVLLTATADGLGASYYNQPLEMPDLRQRVQDDLKLTGIPQLVLRFGRPVGRWPVPTPRRPVDELLLP
jgi:hypothetical protein